MSKIRISRFWWLCDVTVAMLSASVASALNAGIPTVTSASDWVVSEMTGLLLLA